MSNKNIVWHDQYISKSKREKLLSQKPCILWFTGFSGSGKSTISNALEQTLYDRGVKTYLLDGDNMRYGLNKDLGFTKLDRMENIRRIGEVSKLFVDAGLIILAAFISPFRSDREIVRDLVKNDEFIEIYVNTPLSVCENRDPKGLYRKARNGEIKNFTGIDSPYEAPQKAEIEIKTDQLTVAESVKKIINYLIDYGYIKGNK